jgi:hypothetical protein
MSRPPISRENSSHNLARNVEVTNPPPDRDAKSAEQVVKSPPPQLQQKKEANQPQASSDKEFSKEEWKKHGQGSHEQPAQQQPKEKSSQGDQEKSSSKQADTEPKGKAASSARKVNIPSLKLPVSTGVPPSTARLKTRPPVSPDVARSLGSQRAISPRAGEAMGTISTSKVEVGTFATTSKTNNLNGLPASKLTARSCDILERALVRGQIDPSDLGYLLVEVQTGGFNLPISEFSQGKPFLRAGLQVLNFQASNGTTYDSINLITAFLEPMAKKTFNTSECNEIRKLLEKKYLPIATTMAATAKDMRPKEMQQSEKIRILMDPVIRPLTNWVCGENENLDDSRLPQDWKSLLLGIDDAVVQWAKKSQSSDLRAIKRLRSEALVAFISTRGLMIAWGEDLQSFGAKEKIDQGKFTSYINSYFSHRADKFIIDIMLSRKDLVGDKFDSEMRNYLKVLVGQKMLINKSSKENAAGRRSLIKSKTLQSTKAPSVSGSTTINDESITLSPRMREKVEVEKTREIKQKQNIFQRQKYVRDFSKLAKLAEISPEFFKAFQAHVVNDMSNKAYQKFEKDPVRYCQQYLVKFYVGALNKERQAAENSLRAALANIKQHDIDTIVLAAEKAKHIVKPESEIAFSTQGKNASEKISFNQLIAQEKEISEERKHQFFGNLIFYTGIDKMPRDFLTSFRAYVLGLALNEYEKLEADPIKFCLAIKDKFYFSHATTTTKEDRDQLAKQQNKFIDYLKQTTSERLDSLRKSMANPSKTASDAVGVVASLHADFEFPANPFEEDEQTPSRPASTASNQPPHDSLTTRSAKGLLKPEQERQILSERRNNFLDNFVLKTEIADLARGFVPAFKDYVLRLSTAEYLKFEAQPIQKCLDFVDSFYSNPFNTSTPALSALAVSKKSELEWYLNNVSAENLNAICSMAVTISVPHSTASNFPLQDSRITPAVKDAVSKKTESISVTEIVTESDSDANDAASEKTEES